MKIALAIFKYFAPSSGVQSDVLPLAEELHRRGHDITLYCTSWDAPHPPEWLNVIKLQSTGWTNPQRSKHFIKRLFRRLSKTPADILVAFNRIPGADFYFAGDRPIAGQSRRVWWENLSPRYRHNASLEREIFSLESATHILYSHPRQKSACQRLYGTPERRFTLLPVGIPANRKLSLEDRQGIRDAVREKYHLKADDLLLLTEGINPAAVGADRAIAAISAMPEEFHHQLKLLISCRGQLKKLRHLVHHLGLDDYVILLPQDDDMLELFPAADLLLHPVRNETAGIAPLEAIASGTPVLAAGNSGFDHFIRESGGLVLPIPFRRSDLIRALRLLLVDRSRLDEMKRAASSYAEATDFYHRSEAAADAIERIKSR